MSEGRDDNRRDWNDRDYGERRRETDEKEEKEEKKEEKAVEEKSRQDPVGSMVWAATLIWAGVVLLMQNLGWLDALRIELADIEFDLPVGIEAWVGAWQLFFLGAGVLVLLGVIVRLLVPEYRRPILGNLIWAIVLFGIALGQWSLIWPLILIAIGLSLLLGALMRRT